MLVQIFHIYGETTLKNTHARYDATAEMSYDLGDPVEIVFNAVDDLRKIEELAGNLYTPMQMVDLGYIIISNNSLLCSDLRHWIHREMVYQI